MSKTATFPLLSAQIPAVGGEMWCAEEGQRGRGHLHFNLDEKQNSSGRKKTPQKQNGQKTVEKRKQTDQQMQPAHD